MTDIRQGGAAAVSGGAESYARYERSLCWGDRSEKRSAVVGVEPEGGVGGVAHGPEEQNGVGTPDNFQRLWTPHRMAYIRGESKPVDESSGECPFCRIPTLADAEGLVVRRGELAYVVLNLYPYAPGHLMVCPYRHVADYVDTSAEEATEIAAMTKTAVRTLRAVSRAAGFNIGMNQGTAGGAGIAAHLHQHVVPRWIGDTNFMPVIGHTKALPELLQDTRRLLADAWGG